MPAFQVTLTDANTNYNLLTLVRAIDSTFVDQGNISIQTDPANLGAVLMGDSNLSATRYGAKLSGGSSMFYEKKALRGRYARSATAAQKLNIEVAR
jgi:hypothetical protein